MTDWVRQVLERYGQEAVVRSEAGEASIRGFLQPVAERDEQMRTAPTPLGWKDGRLWLYLGRTALGEQDILEWNGLTFRVRSCRPYYIGERLSHYWAALEREQEAAGCGN